MIERIEKIKDPFLGIFGKGVEMKKAIQNLENL